MNNPKWEYKLLVIKTYRNTSTELPDNMNEKFNELGAEGWELIKMEPIQKSGFIFLGIGSTSYTSSIIATFKRMKN